MTLGILSVWSILAVVPVSFHTLGAAALLATLTALSTWGWMGSARDTGPADTYDHPRAVATGGD